MILGIRHKQLAVVAAQRTAFRHVKLSTIRASAIAERLYVDTLARVRTRHRQQLSTTVYTRAVVVQHTLLDVVVVVVVMVVRTREQERANAYVVPLIIPAHVVEKDDVGGRNVACESGELYATLTLLESDDDARGGG